METKKRKFIPDIRVSGGTPLSLQNIRALAKASPAGFIQRVQKLIADGKINLSSFDLKGLRAVLSDVKIPIVMEVGGAQRAVQASAFPILVGNAVVAQINSRYIEIPTIGEQLVEEIDDNKKVTTVASIYALDKGQGEVKEGQDFPEIGAGDEKAEIRHKRNGRRLTLTQEAIEENEIAGFVQQVNALAFIASDYVEEQTLLRVTDNSGSAATPAEPYAYRPNGTGTQLYISTDNLPGARAPQGTRVLSNALADETDLENARSMLAAMKNSRGKRIGIPMSEVILLVPDALTSKAFKILNSEYVPGVENEINPWGPRGAWKPKPLSSPKLDDISTTTWYMGAFRRQFMRKWKLRFEYVTLGIDTESYLRARIAFQARIAWDCEIGATDYVYVVQSISGVADANADTVVSEN